MMLDYGGFLLCTNHTFEIVIFPQVYAYSGQKFFQRVLQHLEAISLNSGEASKMFNSNKTQEVNISPDM